MPCINVCAQLETAMVGPTSMYASARAAQGFRYLITLSSTNYRLSAAILAAVPCDEGRCARQDCTHFCEPAAMRCRGKTVATMGVYRSDRSQMQQILPSNACWVNYVCGARNIFDAIHDLDPAPGSKPSLVLGWLYFFDLIARFGVRHWRTKQIEAIAKGRVDVSGKL